jgi:hypothetical protein
MSNRKKYKKNERPRQVGLDLFAALTEQEIAQLLDALFAVLPPSLREQALEHLLPDTKQAVQHYLSPPTEPEEASLPQSQSVSIARLQQTWTHLWSEWTGIVAEAAMEDGSYIVQDAHWEPPYFDQVTFIEDLEKVAQEMRPLIQSAFHHGFSPDTGFAQALIEAEDEIATALPDWIDIVEGFDLEENLTACLLEGEWLIFKKEKQDAFIFAQRVLGWEEQFAYASLDGNALLDFFIGLPEVDQRAIFIGLDNHKDNLAWESLLENPYSHWHRLYQHGIEKYAPEKLLDHLRGTISQRWENGLPVIEDFLAKRDYSGSLEVIQETVDSLLKSERANQEWTPENALLFAGISWYQAGADRFEPHKSLLRYAKQTAQGLGHTDRAHALSLQHLAFEDFFNWQSMITAFEESSVPESVRKALLASWRQRIIALSKQSLDIYPWEYKRPQPLEVWWLHWLIDSIIDAKKGARWFQQQLRDWLAQLPSDKDALGEDYEFLRLLTRDLATLEPDLKKQYPRFFDVVIKGRTTPSADSSSRQAYLKQYAASELPALVMNYWKKALRAIVPKPENVKKSNYTLHARWMTALRELAPQDYQTLLDQWKVDHQRRRNLWKAMAEQGLA